MTSRGLGTLQDTCAHSCLQPHPSLSCYGGPDPDTQGSQRFLRALSSVLTNGAASVEGHRAPQGRGFSSPPWRHVAVSLRAVSSEQASVGPLRAEVWIKGLTDSRELGSCRQGSPWLLPSELGEGWGTGWQVTSWED
ncbi:hypothetical protein TREES_T100006448 [Tupaia chinensis]|uniref:Uncharacterized protein n=1 Tax=Tupaia chinensis TaxID=246437 RepID=L9KVL5_TUPCH|nr:hypothetical protein TREES_T100006448 [Tupaia chinensis]